MKKNLLFALSLCIVVSTLLTGCKSSDNKDVDYTSIRNKEAALITKIIASEMPNYWIIEDSLVEEFTDILISEPDAAMTYGFDSLMSFCANTYDVYSDDSLVREFGIVEGSMICGTIYARLYRDGDEVRVLPPGEDENYNLCRFTQALYNVEKGKYISVDCSRSGPTLFLFAFLYDFNGDIPLFKKVASSSFEEDEPIDLDAFVWDPDSKTLSLPLTTEENPVWTGEYATYKWNGETLLPL